MQVAVTADGKPGMAAIVKRFGDGVQVNDPGIEIRASFKIQHRKGNVIDPGRLDLGFQLTQKQYDEKAENGFFHVNKVEQEDKINKLKHLFLHPAILMNSLPGPVVQWIE